MLATLTYRTYQCNPFADGAPLFDNFVLSADLGQLLGLHVNFLRFSHTAHHHDYSWAGPAESPQRKKIGHRREPSANLSRFIGLAREKGGKG